MIGEQTWRSNVFCFWKKEKRKKKKEVGTREKYTPKIACAPHRERASRQALVGESISPLRRLPPSLEAASAF